MFSITAYSTKYFVLICTNTNPRMNFVPARLYYSHICLKFTFFTILALIYIHVQSWNQQHPMDDKEYLDLYSTDINIHKPWVAVNGHQFQ